MDRGAPERLPDRLGPDRQAPYRDRVGQAACRLGKRVRLFTAAALVNRWEEAVAREPPFATPGIHERPRVQRRETSPALPPTSALRDSEASTRRTYRGCRS